MLLRISLIIAIIAGLAAGTLSYIQWSDQIPALKKQRDEEKNAKVSEIAAHGNTKNKLKRTESELTQTQEELATTRTARDREMARADGLAANVSALTERLSNITKERDDAQNELASYKVTNLTPEQIVALSKKLKAANDEIAAVKTELAAAIRSRDAWKIKYEYLAGIKVQPIELPAGLAGKIIVVDPKWDFVVVNVGEEEGVLQGGELLVSRGGRLVAKVIVQSVQKGRCIANLLPGWRIGEPIEGDDVTPAHPAS